MTPSPTALFEPVMRLTQANLSTWTQFWMSPDQPWSPMRQDLFGARLSAAAPSATFEAVSKLWNGLVENQGRFMADMGQRGLAVWQTAPRAAADAARETTAAATT